MNDETNSLLRSIDGKLRDIRELLHCSLKVQSNSDWPCSFEEEHPAASRLPEGSHPEPEKQTAP